MINPVTPEILIAQRLLHNIKNNNLLQLNCSNCGTSLNIDYVLYNAKCAKTFSCACNSYEIRLNKAMFDDQYINTVDIYKYIQFDNMRYRIFVGFSYPNIISFSLYNISKSIEVIRTDYCPLSNLSDQETTINELETIITLL